jgi:hypothetical protein
MFRAGKSYILRNSLTQKEIDNVTRIRGIPRKAHRHLEQCHFSQDPAVNRCVIRTTAMRPTGDGNEMIMTRESKTLSNTINAYRKMIVSISFL